MVKIHKDTKLFFKNDLDAFRPRSRQISYCINFQHNSNEHSIAVLDGGTSFPELATCIVAAAKPKDQMALGNILGSNVFNILLILGCSSIITPLSFAGMNLADELMLLAFAGYYYYLFTKL